MSRAAEPAPQAAAVSPPAPASDALTPVAHADTRQTPADEGVDEAAAHIELPAPEAATTGAPAITAEDDVHAGAEIAAPPPVPPPAAEGGKAARPSAMDPLLHDIYSKETSSHLDEIREYLSKRADQPAPHLLTESVYRAIHTLERQLQDGRSAPRYPHHGAVESL